MQLTKRQWVILLKALGLARATLEQDYDLFPWDSSDDGACPGTAEIDNLAVVVGQMSWSGPSPAAAETVAAGGAAVLLAKLFPAQIDAVREMRARAHLHTLQAMLRAAPDATHQLCETRVLCPAAVEAADCPAVPYDDGSGTLSLGMLGVINGLMPAGWRLVAHYADGPGGKLFDFSLMRWPPERRMVEAERKLAEAAG